MKTLTQNKMWAACVSSDSSYDGAFYYAVKTTGIVCRPSCRSKVPKRENVSFFFCLDGALDKGYRPCKRCRPDLGVQYDPETEYIERACHVLEIGYQKPDILEELSSCMWISSFHLLRLFKKATGYTPRKYLQAIRIRKAEELLALNQMNNTEICFEVGFKSLSSFYSAFRLHNGFTPKTFRRFQGVKGTGSNDSL